MGRKVGTYENINNGTNVLLSQNAYNETGQLFTKQLHSTNNGSSFLQQVTYNYNERGWLNKSTAPLFEEQIQYDKSEVSGLTPTVQYNGNIASQSWGTSTSPNTKSYTYAYDNLNRLTMGKATDGYTERGISYDVMGNIKIISRLTNSTLTDSLTYSYINSNNSNQLNTIVAF